MPGKLNGVMAATTPDRLPDHQLVDARRDVLEVAAHHQRRNAGGDLDVLDAALQLAVGFGERLAAFVRDDARQLGVVRVEQRLQAEERLNAVAGRRAPPRRQRVGGRAHGLCRRRWPTTAARKRVSRGSPGCRPETARSPSRRAPAAADEVLKNALTIMRSSHRQEKKATKRIIPSFNCCLQR